MQGQEEHQYFSLQESDYNFDSEDNMYEAFESEAVEEVPQDYSPGVGWFRLLNFAYPWLHLRKHIKSDLTIDQFPRPQRSENCEARASSIFQKLKPKTHTTRRLLMSEFKWELIFSCFLVVIDFMVRLLNSFVMGHVIKLLTSDDENDKANLIIGSFFGLLLVGIYTKLWVFHYCSELGAKLRFTLTYLAYFKTMKVSTTNLLEYGLGRVMNLVSNDFNDLDNGLVWIIQLCMLPINLSVATYALWHSFHSYALVGLLVLILSLKLQDAINKTVKQPVRQKNKISDRRIYYCKELVKNIRTVKMYVWEEQLLNIIGDLRRKQTQFNFNIMLSQGISKMLSYFSLMISVLSMVLAQVLIEPKQDLKRQSIYASIGIFGVIRNTNFNGGLNYFTSINIVIDRVDSFLQLEDIRERRHQRLEYKTKVSTEIELESIVIAAKLKVQNKLEHKSSEMVYVFRKDDKMVKKIGQLNLSNQRRVFVYGLSGSGKTSLVQAFLNESKYYQIENLKGTLSYVPQQPVLFSGTIKDNITFGTAWDQERFNTVISACCLDRDFERFPEGADSKVSMQGSSFSGGQRARIALARALYSNSQVIIFDNCLSALDPKVRKQVHQNIMGEKFEDRIYIFSTSKEDEVMPNGFLIHIANQKVKYFGPYKEGALPAGTRHLQVLEVRQESDQKPLLVVPQSSDAIVEDSGSVSKETYLYYVEHFGKGYKGYLKLAVVIALFICCELSVLIFYKQLPLLGQGTWVKLKEIGNYLTMYLCLDYLRMYVMVVLACTNSMDCHQKFIHKIAYAQYGWFFKKQSELVNVFANHVGIIDRPLPNIVYDVVKGLLSNAIYIISLCVVTPAFIPLAIILTLGFWGVKRALREYIRKSKIFELKFRSPVYNQLAEVFTGSTVVRAFNCERQFNHKFRGLIYNSEKTYFAFIKMNRFFDLVLELIVFLMIVLGITFTNLFNQETGRKQANLALSIFTLINMTSELSFNIRQTLAVELNLISLEKVLSYKDVPTENLTPPVEEQPALSGDIVFKNVKLKYPGSNNYCLNQLNMTIKEGEKIALMGRTGAGKSSIFLALYRLFDIEPESLISIGGRDISTLDLYTLRKKCLSASAQDPMKLLPLTSDCSPSQLKYKSIVDGDITPVKCLDEPFANIDSSLEDDIWKHIARMRTVLSVVHSGNLQRWDRILILQDGKISRDIKKEQMKKEEPRSASPPKSKRESQFSEE